MKKTVSILTLALAAAFAVPAAAAKHPKAGASQKDGTEQVAKKPKKASKKSKA